jgi:DNA-binding MarR family transcriptional regulator
MSFDPLVANAGRLNILTSLAVEERQEFVQLRRSTRLTDGNLACHARRLQSGGLVAIDKQFRDGKPITHFTLTIQGRKALEMHTRRLMAAISQRRLAPLGTATAEAFQPQPVAAVESPALELTSASDDDWVD